MKKIGILIFLYLLFPLSVFAEVNEDYEILSYDIYMKVQENNILEITETITAYFNTEKHGIIRKIPLINTVERLDGTTEKNRVQISGVDVNHPFTTRKNGKNYVIQIGEEDKLIEGEQTYEISYSYNLGKDKIKDYDELYFNLIGDEWDTEISFVTFTIEMPKSFDEELVGFSYGKKGSTESENVYYEIEGNTINGLYEDTLEPGEALTVRLELEDGYFVDAKLNVGITTYLMFIIPPLCLLGAFLLWLFYGKDKEVIETVEFYPPKKCNSLDVGFLYRGKFLSKDVTSLLIYLANQGYIKITDNSEGQKNSFVFTKLKDYDGKNEAEKLFMEGLFEEKEEVTGEDLQDHFYITVSKIMSVEKEMREKVFEKNGKKKSLIILLIVATLIIIILAPSLEFGDMSSFWSALFLVVALMAFGGCAIYMPSTLIGKVLATTIITLMMSPFFISSSLGYAFEEGVFRLGIIIGILALIGLIVIYLYMDKRTDYGIEMLGKIRGFKTFLETAEKDRLEKMVSKEPTYFYDILPFTYVLGVSSVWIKKFESITLAPPSWYDSSDDFEMVGFTHFMDSTMEEANRVMNSSPVSSSDSSSSSSSGGGSSGGGSGGGGGSSW